MAAAASSSVSGVMTENPRSCNTAARYNASSRTRPYMSIRFPCVVRLVSPRRSGNSGGELCPFLPRALAAAGTTNGLGNVQSWSWETLIFDIGAQQYTHLSWRYKWACLRTEKFWKEESFRSILLESDDALASMDATASNLFAIVLLQ